MSQEKECINCGSISSGNFCVECGQKKEVERITLASLFNQYLGRLIGLDTKFLRTLKDLTISPGIVGQSYIQGNRVRYIEPVGYFIIFTTLFLLSFSIFGVEIEEYMRSNANSFLTAQQQTADQTEFQELMFETMSKNMRLLNFLSVPFFGLVSLWFYRKSNYNFLEHLVNVFYLHGHLSIFSIISVIILRFTGYQTIGYIAFISTLYYAWGVVKFYEKKGILQWIKAIVLYMIAMLLFIITLMILTSIVLFVYVKFFNPDFLG